MLKILVLATLAGTVLAQSSTSPAASGSTASTLAPLPQCAQICLGNALAYQGDCSSIDIKCLCKNMNYDNALSCCIYQNCGAADQQTALAFNVRQCGSVNVTIPNVIGCSQNGTAGGKGATAVEGAISVATTAVATFGGAKLLTGTCTSTQFASVTLGPGQALEYPWLGCSNEEPGCCPFDPKVGGALSVCPADYITTQGGCCPSGWSVHSDAIAGETPCVTTPSSPLKAPTGLPSAGASVSVITSQLFSLKYTLASKSSSTLAAGAIAGIAVGAAVGIGVVAAAVILLIRKRRAKAHSEREAATVKSPRADTFEVGSSHIGSPVTELPSPATPGRVPPLTWQGHQPPTPTTPAQPAGGAELPAAETPTRAPPVEMVGDTYMNEHHPALSPPNSPPLRDSFHTSGEGAESLHNPQRDTMVSIGTEEAADSPIYSPIGGSALLPDSPHLDSAFKSTQRPISEATSGPTSRPTSGEFVESPQRTGSVRERVEDFEKGRDT